MIFMHFRKIPLILFLCIYFLFFSVYWVPVKQAEAALPAVVAGWVARKGIMKAGQHIGVAIATRAGVKFASTPAAQKAYTTWFQRSGAAQTAMEGARKVAPGSRAGWSKWLFGGLTASAFVTQTVAVYDSIMDVINTISGVPNMYEYKDGVIDGSTDQLFFAEFGQAISDVETYVSDIGGVSPGSPFVYNLPLEPGKLYQNQTTSYFNVFEPLDGTTQAIKAGKYYYYLPLNSWLLFPYGDDGKYYFFRSYVSDYGSYSSYNDSWGARANLDVKVFDNNLNYLHDDFYNNKKSVLTIGSAAEIPSLFGFLIELDGDYLKYKTLIDGASYVSSARSGSCGKYDLSVAGAAPEFIPIIEPMDSSDLEIIEMPDINEVESPLVVEVPDIDYLETMFPNLSYEELLEKAINMILQNPDYVIAPESLVDYGSLPESWFDPAGEPIGDPIPSADPSTPIIDDTSINWEPLQVLGDELTRKFPFSLPWDLLRGVESLEATGWDRKIIISVGDGIWPPMVIDLSMFDDIAGITRVVLLVIFDFGLIFSTRRLMGGDV